VAMAMDTFVFFGGDNQRTFGFCFVFLVSPLLYNSLNQKKQKTKSGGESGYLNQKKIKINLKSLHSHGYLGD